MIRPASPEDSQVICEIYNHYVTESVATFDEEPVSASDVARRIVECRGSMPWLVIAIDSAVVGYAYAAPWKTRSAYRFSVECTIYLAPPCTGRGIGSELYRALIAELPRRGVHCAIGGIALPNPASVALHEKLGFEKIGEFKEVGWKLGTWVDVGYWELVF